MKQITPTPDLEIYAYHGDVHIGPIVCLPHEAEEIADALEDADLADRIVEAAEVARGKRERIRHAFDRVFHDSSRDQRPEDLQ
jgi:hypothetical protein